MSATARRLRALPSGTFAATRHGRRYLVSVTRFAGGRSLKLVAHALDGSDYISLNFYDLSAGPRIAPCEMPLEKVLDFVRGLGSLAKLRQPISINTSA